MTYCVNALLLGKSRPNGPPGTPNTPVTKCVPLKCYLYKHTLQVHGCAQNKERNVRNLIDALAAMYQLLVNAFNNIHNFLVIQSW